MVEWCTSPSQNFPRKSRLNGQGDEEDDDDCNIDVSRFFPNSSKAKNDDDDVARDSDGNELPMFQDEPCLESDEADPHRFTRITQRWKKGKTSKPEGEPPPEEPVKSDAEEVMMKSIREAELLNKRMLERTMNSAKRRSANNPASKGTKNPPTEEKMTPITPRTYFAQRSVFPSQSSNVPQADKVTVLQSGPTKRRLPGLLTSTPTSTSSKRFCSETKYFAEMDISPISGPETFQERQLFTQMVESPKSRPSSSKPRPSARPALRSSLVSSKPSTTMAKTSSSKQVQPEKEEHKEVIAKTLPTSKPETKSKPPKEEDDFVWDD